MPRSPWLASAACTKKAGVPVEASVAAILRADMAGLAHAGDDDAAARVADRVDRGNEGAPSPSRHGRGERGDAVALGIERAQRRSDVRLVAGFASSASAERIFARVLTPATATMRRISASRLFRPGGERIGEGPVAGRAFLQGQDGAAAVVIDDRNVEPRPVLSKLQIALHVGVDGGQARSGKSRW